MCFPVQDWEGETRYAEYGFFTVGNELNSYKLFLANYSGNAGDSLRYHNNTNFSTNNKDNDKCVDDCASLRKGKLSKQSMLSFTLVATRRYLPSIKCMSNFVFLTSLQVVTGTTAALTQI